MASGGQQGRVWDPHSMYDVTPEEKRAIVERGRMRADLKKEWQKKYTSPHKGVGGTIFDPAIQRYMSMRCTHWDQFKPSPKNAAFAMCASVFPILFCWWYLEREGKQKEKMYRSGAIAYKDRDWKFVN